jgi:hypothetical protein
MLRLAVRASWLRALVTSTLGVRKDTFMSDDAKRSERLIEEAIQNLRATLNEQLTRLEESLKSKSGDIHAKVAERKSLARNLALDEKITTIWEEVKYYPTWSIRDDWLKHRQCEIQDPQGDKRDKEVDVSFLLNNHRYKLTYHDDGGTTGPDGEYYRHTQLSLREATDRVLIEINISVDYDEVGPVLKPFGVSAFVAGDWIQDFLEFYERLQANKKERNIRQKYDSEEVADLKNRFNIE